MAFKNEAGSNLTEVELRALLTEVSADTVYTVGANVLQSFTLPGASTFEGGERLFLSAGQRVTESYIDGIFKTATVDTVTPATGDDAGGTNIVIDGTNFAGAEGVTVGGAAATNFVVVSNTRITCTTPAGTAGARDVVVKDDAGDVTKAGAFTYTA